MTGRKAFRGWSAFLIFSFGQAVSYAGDALRRTAAMLWVFSATGQSGIAMAALTLAEVTPYALAAPFAGALVDLWGERRVLLVADLGRALLGPVFVLSAVTGSWLAVYAALAASALLSAFSGIAQSAAVPMLVEQHRLERANSLVLVSEQLALVVGPLLGAALYSWFGVWPAFALQGAASAIAVVATLLVPRELWQAKGEKAALTSQLGDRLWRGLRGGARYVARTPLILASLIVVLLMSLSAGINNMVTIFFITRTLGRDPTEIAWLSAANGIVQIVMAGYLMLFVAGVKLHRLLKLSVAAMALGGVAMAASPSVVVLVLGVMMTSLGNAPFNIAFMTMVQRYSAPGFLGRVRGVVDASGTAMFLAASSAAGLVVGWTTPRLMLGVSAAVMVIASLLVTLELGPALRRTGLGKGEERGPDSR